MLPHEDKKQEDNSKNSSWQRLYPICKLEVKMWFMNYVTALLFKTSDMGLLYGGWFVPFRIIVFSGRKGEKAQRENPPNGDFSCFRMATFRLATRKYDTFHVSPFRLLFVVSLPGGAKGRHANTRQYHHLAGFRVATFRPARRKREKSPRENPPNGDCFVFSHGDLSPHHMKVRDIPGWDCAISFLLYSILKSQSLTPVIFMTKEYILICHYAWVER